MLHDITRKVRPPRALAVPYSLGFPLGRPGDAQLQRGIIEALLALLPREDVPVLEPLNL